MDGDAVQAVAVVDVGVKIGGVEVSARRKCRARFSTRRL